MLRELSTLHKLTDKSIALFASEVNIARVPEYIQNFCKNAIVLHIFLGKCCLQITKYLTRFLRQFSLNLQNVFDLDL